MKTIKAIIGIGFGILLGLSLTSCAPPEGCYYQDYFDGGVVITERVNAFGDLIITERPTTRRELICTPEDRQYFDEVYTAVEE